MPKELTEIYIPQSSCLITGELQFVRQLKGSKVGGAGVGQTQDCDGDLIDYAANFSYLCRNLYLYLCQGKVVMRVTKISGFQRKQKLRDGSVLTTRQRIEPLVSDKTAIFGKLRGVFRRKKI